MTDPRGDVSDAAVARADAGAVSGSGALPAGLTLLMESSTALGSVAVFDGNALVSEVEAQLRDRNSERLMPAVTEALLLAGVKVSGLSRVACGAGPGSFTGLRIGAAIAKGLAHAAKLPLHAVSSLLLTGAKGAVRHAGAGGEDGLYLAALDAMRGESFALLVRSAGGRAAASGAVELHPTNSLPRIAETLGARLVGPAHGDVWPGAGALGACVGSALGEPLDLASWEPYYGRVAEAQARWEAAHGRSLAGA
ncbi:MAG TPA: tRNA (adenosine(37)-N6)-threonylcarbamoyltransferase complex dimerization subunit type 1 TsaB [Gemmatimonadales bacterium]|nr:tRNA (adenosine(37)-N6)-threonylcarbamoyltransferase complex dimerization subunit type 1 TsaB [Gemmatimonadales bacterium]